MKILSLDLARVTGWAWNGGGGLAHGSIELRKPGEPNGLGPGALGRWIVRHSREHDRPDLIVVEHWMAPSAQKSDSIIEDSLRLNGAVHGVAGVFGIEVSEPYPATVRVAVCNRAHMPGESSREGKRLPNTKWLVIDSLILRGLVPKNFADHNAADAIAGLVWAEAAFTKQDRSFVLASG